MEVEAPHEQSSIRSLDSQEKIPPVGDPTDPFSIAVEAFASIKNDLEELLDENGSVGSLKRHFQSAENPTTLSNPDFANRMEKIKNELAPLLERFESVNNAEMAARGRDVRLQNKGTMMLRTKICELLAKIFKELQIIEKTEVPQLSAMFADEVDFLFTTTILISAHATNSKHGTAVRKQLSHYENMVIWAYSHKIETTEDWLQKPLGQFLSLIDSSHSPRNQASLFGLLLSIPAESYQKALVEMLAHFYETDEINPDAMAASFIRALKLALMQGEIAGEEKARKMERHVQALLKEVLKTPRPWFLKNILPMIKKIGKSAHGDKELQTSLYNVYYFMRNNGASVANKIMSHQAETIMLLLTPNLPSGLERENFDAEFFGQFRLMLNSMVVADFEMRIAAIEKFKVWMSNYWDSLVEYQLENVVEGFQTLAKIMLHFESCAKTAEAAINTLTDIIKENQSAHSLIYDIFAGDESFKKRTENAINVSRVITAKNVKVRLAFVRLLRTCNKTLFVKWNHICQPKRLYRRLLEENDSQVKAEIAMLARHIFFKAKDASDKAGVIETIKTLTKLHEESSELCMVLLPEVLDGWEAMGFTVKLLLTILRKLAHLVKHEIGERKKLEEEGNADGSNATMGVLPASLMIGAAIFRSHYMATTQKTYYQYMKKKEGGEEIPKEAEENMKLVEEVDILWKGITEKSFSLNHDSREMKLAIVFLAGVWKHDDIETISVPLRGAIKRGTVNPSVIVQAFVKWNRLADVWCEINLWFHKQKEPKEQERRGVRFASENEEEEVLTLTHVIQYIRAMSEYKSTFGHKEAAETFDQISDFMEKFFSEIRSSEKLSSVYEEAAAGQFEYLARLRFQLNLAKGRAENKFISKQVDFSEYHDILVSEKHRYGNEKKLQAIFIGDMMSITNALRETLDVIKPGWAIEEQMRNILTENKDLVRAHLFAIRQFVESLIRHKLVKEKENGDFFTLAEIVVFVFKTLGGERGFSKSEMATIQGHFDFLGRVTQKNLRHTFDVAFMDFLKDSHFLLKPFRDRFCNADFGHIERVWNEWSAKESDANVIEMIREELYSRMKFKRADCPAPGTHPLFPLQNRPESSLSNVSDGFDNDEPLLRRGSNETQSF